MSKKNKPPLPAPESLGLPPVGVESHAHLDMEPFRDDLDQVLARARAAGVREIGQVFLGPAAYREGRSRFAAHEQVFFLLGIHPHDAVTCNHDALVAMDQAFAQDPRLRALGETGLDYYYMHSPMDVQQRAFRDQLALARERDLPVVVHSRDAEEDTVAILLDMGFAHRPLLWHCFGRDAAFAGRLLELGWHISIPGPVTFPKSQALREAAAIVPDDRLLLETDCPFLSPAPYRGRRNEPAYMVFTAQAVALARGVAVEEVWQRCGDAARGFFGLPSV